MKKIIGYVLLVLGIVSFLGFIVEESDLKTVLSVLSIIIGIHSFAFLVSWLITDDYEKDN